jgi:hypothetical protein
MSDMFKKIEIIKKFDTKRNFKIITPCCNRSNSDGKFVNYKELPEIYGYCHSCGKSSLPPSIYEDQDGNQYFWNDNQNKFESVLVYAGPITKSTKNTSKHEVVEQKFIEESLIWEHFHLIPENNLLFYLRKTYGNSRVDDAKETFVLGSTKDGGSCFWSINTNLKIQKEKIAYYDHNGKRTNKFVVPFKNEDGYYNCLFGEHLLCDINKGKKTVVLVESEKTAIVGYILFPKYDWLAYCGINGLTDNKLSPLIGHNVLIIPDMSENAVSIIFCKIQKLNEMGINAKIWDMTCGKTDQQLKEEGLYNCDLEDVIRKIV